MGEKNTLKTITFHRIEDIYKFIINTLTRIHPASHLSEGSTGLGTYLVFFQLVDGAVDPGCPPHRLDLRPDFIYNLWSLG